MNAPAVAVRIENRLLYDFIDNFMIIFMDDILVHSKTAAELAKEDGTPQGTNLEVDGA